ncbi:hypothetical protein [uncultured Dialister sp.]|uniref:hypothetical protein n=1 Tax=uncultured Dialister sp. TaxID=278064 RepID=UPI0025E09984|nr:hypothetical protein [uncultured Dialister sp.]
MAQPKFDKYESVLLLDAYLQIENGKKWKDAKRDLSCALRQKALNKGEVINDIYRNESGMSWQLGYMSKAWTGEYTDKNKPARIFLETVDLYRNARPAYEKLLQEAKDLAKGPKEMPATVAEGEETDPELIGAIKNEMEGTFRPFAPSKLGRRKKEIIRITITSHSGYCPADYAYDDELTIEPTGIRYNRNPYIETDTNLSRHWAYHTDSSSFKNFFEEAASKVRKVLAKTCIFEVEDVPSRGISITYSDNKNEGQGYIRMPEEYKEFAAVVRKMVPKFEGKPELLKFNG